MLGWASHKSSRNTSKDTSAIYEGGMMIIDVNNVRESVEKYWLTPAATDPTQGREGCVMCEDALRMCPAYVWLDVENAATQLQR